MNPLFFPPSPLILTWNWNCLSREINVFIKLGKFLDMMSSNILLLILKQQKSWWAASYKLRKAPIWQQESRLLIPTLVTNCSLPRIEPQMRWKTLSRDPDSEPRTQRTHARLLNHRNWEVINVCGLKWLGFMVVVRQQKLTLKQKEETMAFKVMASKCHSKWDHFSVGVYINLLDAYCVSQLCIIMTKYLR